MFKKLFNKTYTVEAFQELLMVRPPDLKEVGKALQNGIDINYLNDKDETFLHFTIKKGLSTYARYLIDHGIDVNAKDKEDNSAIHLAVDKSNKTVTQALIATNKININELKDNRNLLQEAVLQGDKNIIDMLLRSKINKHHVDNRGRNVIFDAIANGNEKIIDTVLNIDGLDLNIKNSDKNTVLHEKNVLEDDQLAIKLIKKGANPTILDGTGKSYLLHAALRGIDAEPIIDAAMESGFNINSSVRNKNSILMEIMFSFSGLSEAESHRRDNLMSMASKLVKKGIDVNAINDKGETALFEAVRKLDTPACAFLIKEKVPINIINHQGNSALSEVIYQGIQAVDIIYLLLKNGADVKITNKNGQNLVEIINDLVLYTHGNIKTINNEILEHINPNGQYIRLLSEMIALTSYNTSALSTKGEPLFFSSLLNNNKSLFDLYYKLGININAIDKNGHTIFSRYIDQTSKDEELPKDFRETVLMLITRQVNINQQDEVGKTLLSRLVTNNNMRMFKTLFSMTRFNYKLRDKRGFTIIHDCISSSNITVLKLIDQIEPSLKNTPDFIGLLPITYAALFGKIDVVRVLLNLESHFKSNKVIPAPAKAKLTPLLINLDKLISKDKNEQHIFDILKDQIRRDFA